MPFSLHPRLEEDTHALGALPLCRVQLMNNAHFPWLILVPAPKPSTCTRLLPNAPWTHSLFTGGSGETSGEGWEGVYAREIFDLSPADQALLMQEISATAVWLKAHVRAEKMNIAALGNQVPQLHIHIIARFAADAAWPNPVWGRNLPPKPYTGAEVAAWRAAVVDMTNL